ncbi:hypothetical protein N7539_003448 [Penicillium diatomitis]|uniref:RRM domain-containing protein n=1 Tax=Penicillium diatomitis TaxID=2819901 RepID=A0A9W9XCV6_9EURO|nr:uncharacterized protein N7539_003448 [Penicillium diatomitis]KAJ5488558.1 hypothetical protein N7539_003448 [Penicillium diatomitis]
MAQPAAASKATAGVLQIPATATQKSASTTAKKASKPPTPRLKLLIRRLPPGLTQNELEVALGEEWKVGAGKVDWLQYKPGKVSKDPAKPSRPSRAYIHVVNNEHVGLLSDRVRQASFQDAAHTASDPVLLGPPALEFAPYAKTPGSRVRKDARQGTIDQDPEFIAFLESLTQPITKPTPVDALEPEEKKSTVTTTPLVQYIKEKKANKAKENAANKSSKRSEKESKPEKVLAKKLLQRPEKKSAPGPTPEEKPKSEKAGKEHGKAAKATASGPSAKGGKSASANTTRESTPAAGHERKRERGSAAAAAKILQRDLGLTQPSSRRRGKGGSNETGPAKTEASQESSAQATEGGKKEILVNPGKNAGGSASKGKAREAQDSLPQVPGAPSTPQASAPAAAAKGAKASKSKGNAGSTSTATQAFLKHANASQGVTEALLETAFAAFGTVSKVEIDKKKGFGYVDFSEPSALRRAISASPVTVAQSQIVVLERKANPSSEKSRKGGGGGGGGGGGRGEAAQQGKVEKAKASEAAAGATTTNGTAGANAGGGGSSRGSRGGRGSRKKGGGGGENAKAGSNGDTAGNATASVSGGKAGSSNSK